ncbi:hypothetical protein BJV78DRAFT_1221988 [Lactifluus subvellereus]|nr:hypothetical protein BJV78DRAFT_1221988 [Lactifluus subvellereus]
MIGSLLSMRLHPFRDLGEVLKTVTRHVLYAVRSNTEIRVTFAVEKSVRYSLPLIISGFPLARFDKGVGLMALTTSKRCCQKQSHGCS